ncbi:MAG: Spo0B domain-containing protein [Treponema sp.]|nr:Spo0B domain-containing protein [Treponema sp.]MBQ5383264.1 Spo0B domain-containing protein [Treponema sp.]
MEKKSDNRGKLDSIRKEIKRTQLILIISVTVLLTIGGAIININSNDKSFNQILQETSELITRLYHFTKDYSQEDLCKYMDSVVAQLPDVDVISIVDKNNNRIYHTNHALINTQYDGTHPDFSMHQKGFYTENDIGPSGPQRRTYSAIYDDYGEYRGFIMTIRLQVSMRLVTIRIISLFVSVVVFAILLELAICTYISKKIKREFLEFTEDFEGTKFLVDSMRANNHDFTNKLHVILGLIQIQEYDKAVSYIENISIIQRETVSMIMHTIENPSFAALLVGKIARASECNVKFVLKEGLHFKSEDIAVPSEALVTITGNLIDNALDSMNMDMSFEKTKELVFGAFTKPGELLITVKDNGLGISEENLDKIFENGYSTKGSGRGVGLYHTKQLIESLGGSISVESQVGKGACFMVILKNKR